MTIEAIKYPALEIVAVEIAMLTLEQEVYRQHLERIDRLIEKARQLKREIEAKP